MPITTFSSVTDGLDANRRSREHFTANIDVPKTNADGFHMRMGSGSSLAASTLRLADSASF